MKDSGVVLIFGQDIGDGGDVKVGTIAKPVEEVKNVTEGRLIPEKDDRKNMRGVGNAIE